jgi:hypothetical protein
MANNEEVLKHLASVIPDSAYPGDRSEKEDCKNFEAAIYGGWDLLTMFGAKSFTFRGTDPFGQFTQAFANIKELFLAYLDICGKANATASTLFTRELTRKFSESGLAWYCLFMALSRNPMDSTKEEVLRCLTNAAQFGCDYVKPDGNGGFVLTPLS